MDDYDQTRDDWRAMNPDPFALGTGVFLLQIDPDLTEYGERSMTYQQCRSRADEIRALAFQWVPLGISPAKTHLARFAVVDAVMIWNDGKRTQGSSSSSGRTPLAVSIACDSRRNHHARSQRL
jgi:hypothetical protein